MNKQEILNLVIEALQKEEMIVIRANLDATKGATESESKPENQYDTRAIEQSYLAAGQAKRAEDLQYAIITLKSLPLGAFDSHSAVDVTALITVENENGEQRTYFLLPIQGGMKVRVEGREIQTISLESPLGGILLEKHMGDEVTIEASGERRVFQIVNLE